jgi:hypothetical protein
LLVPAEVDVQFAAQEPTHVDCPLQVVVQPVPQLTLQVSFVSQL